MNAEPRLQAWHALIGRWETEGVHRMLPGEAIRGTSTFEWLDGRRFVIWRSHSDHPQIPDAISINFSQRFTGTFSGDGNTITGRGELSKDGTLWEGDLDLDYHRVVRDARRA